MISSCGGLYNIANVNIAFERTMRTGTTERYNKNRLPEHTHSARPFRPCQMCAGAHRLCDPVRIAWGISRQKPPPQRRRRHGDDNTGITLVLCARTCARSPIRQSNDAPMHRHRFRERIVVRECASAARRSVDNPWLRLLWYSCEPAARAGASKIGPFHTRACARTYVCLSHRTRSDGDLSLRAVEIAIPGFCAKLEIGPVLKHNNN